MIFVRFTQLRSNIDQFSSIFGQFQSIKVNLTQFRVTLALVLQHLCKTIALMLMLQLKLNEMMGAGRTNLVPQCRSGSGREWRITAFDPDRLARRIARPLQQVITFEF